MENGTGVDRRRPCSCAIGDIVAIGVFRSSMTEIGGLGRTNSALPYRGGVMEILDICCADTYLPDEGGVIGVGRRGEGTAGEIILAKGLPFEIPDERALDSSSDDSFVSSVTHLKQNTNGGSIISPQLAHLFFVFSALSASPCISREAGGVPAGRSWFAPQIWQNAASFGINRMPHL